jgi:hypothetical protein
MNFVEPSTWLILIAIEAVVLFLLTRQARLAAIQIATCIALDDFLYVTFIALGKWEDDMRIKCQSPNVV